MKLVQAGDDDNDACVVSRLKHLSLQLSSWEWFSGDDNDSVWAMLSAKYCIRLLWLRGVTAPMASLP